MRTRISNRAWALRAVLALVREAVATGQAQKQVTESFAMPARVDAVINTSERDNPPGPQFTLDGAVKPGGLTVEVIFREMAPLRTR